MLIIHRSTTIYYPFHVVKILTNAVAELSIFSLQLIKQLTKQYGVVGRMVNPSSSAGVKYLSRSSCCQSEVPRGFRGRACQCRHRCRYARYCGLSLPDHRINSRSQALRTACNFYMKFLRDFVEKVLEAEANVPSEPKQLWSH